jgi:hypothetical protein
MVSLRAGASGRGGAGASGSGVCVLADGPEMKRLILSSIADVPCGPEVSARRGGTGGGC